MQELNHCVSQGVSVIEILAPRHPRNQLVLPRFPCAISRTVMRSVLRSYEEG